MIRQIHPRDFDTIIELNQNALGSVGPLERTRLQMLIQEAHHALVIDVGGDIAGFVITLTPGARYDSDRYQWFERRLDDYVYLDRVVVAPAHRRRGVASRLYDTVEQGPPVALEIYDTNDVSRAFHRRRGYRRIGTLRQDDTVNLMMLRPA